MHSESCLYTTKHVDFYFIVCTRETYNEHTQICKNPIWFYYLRFIYLKKKYSEENKTFLVQKNCQYKSNVTNYSFCIHWIWLCWSWSFCIYVALNFPVWKGSPLLFFVPCECKMGIIHFIRRDVFILFVRLHLGALCVVCMCKFSSFYAF